MRSRSLLPPLLLLVVALLIAADAVMRPASAGFFDFLFGTFNHAAEQGPHADASDTGLFEVRSARAPLPPIGGGYARASSHCVRLCDGKHFPVHGGGGMSPADMCQAFCPASATKVFFGSEIERAIATDGERYSDLDNAFAYRKQLRRDCTCNGRETAGLAPVDLSLDATLRPGDVVATTSGFVAFSGAGSAGIETGDFTPVASYSGLAAATRARLDKTEIAPLHGEATVDHTGSIDAARAMSRATSRASLN